MIGSPEGLKHYFEISYGLLDGTNNHTSYDSRVLKHMFEKLNESRRLETKIIQKWGLTLRGSAQATANILTAESWRYEAQHVFVEYGAQATRARHYIDPLPHSCSLFVSLHFRGAQDTHLWPYPIPIFVSLYFRGEQDTHLWPFPIPIFVLLYFRGAQGAHLWLAPTLSLFHFIFEAHKAHSHHPTPALSLSSFI